MGMELVAGDMPCVHCGYNLRGLQMGGVCPECGELVSHSRMGRHLAVANPHWRGAVRLGAALYAAGLIVFTLTLLSLIVGPPRRDVVAFYASVLLAASLGAVGVWKMVSPEPGGPHFDDDPWLRHVLQVVSVVSWCGMAGYCIVQFIEKMGGHVAYGIWVWQVVMGIPAFGGGLLATGLTMWHLAHLAMRLDGRFLVLSGRASAFGVPIVIAVVYGLVFGIIRIDRMEWYWVNIPLALTFFVMLLWPASYVLVWRYYAAD